MNRGLFAGVIAWQLAAGALLWRSVGLFLDLVSADADIGAALGFSAALLLADEVFQSSSQKTSHRGQFTSQLLTLLAIHLLR